MDFESFDLNNKIDEKHQYLQTQIEYSKQENKNDFVKSSAK